MHIRELSVYQCIVLIHYTQECVAFPITSRNQQCLSNKLAAAAKPHETSQDELFPRRVFPFSDCGHTFSSQSGICKGNYTSHRDELLPKKEVKTRGCRRKYWLLRHSSRSTYLALNSFSIDLVCAPRSLRIFNLS